MSFAIRVEMRELRRKVKAMGDRRVPALTLTAARMGAAATEQIAIRAAKEARDTGRFERGWVLSHNQAVLHTDGMDTPMAVPVLRPSKRASEVRKRFNVQYEMWVGVEKKLLRWKAGNDARPGHEAWPSYRRLLKRIDKVGDIVDRLIETAEELDRTPDEAMKTAIVIGGKKTQRPGLSNLLRVHTKLYGGAARIVRIGPFTAMEISNMEPHARIVEKRLGIGRQEVSKAVGRLRSYGTRRIPQSYLKKLTAGTGVVTRAA